MLSGTFEVGETVTGTVVQTGLGPDTTNTAASITFRVASANHKEGAYNIPTKIYPENPYVAGQDLPATYSSTSTVLNVDTFSLQAEVQGQYQGYVETGMTLRGSSSGARANITNVRLISDIAAHIAGSFFIPNPNNLNHPRFETGTKTFVLINDEDNDQDCLLYTSPSPRDQRGSRMPSSA